MTVGRPLIYVSEHWSQHGPPGIVPCHEPTLLNLFLFVHPALDVEGLGHLGGVHQRRWIGHWPETLPGGVRLVNVSLSIDIRDVANSLSAGVRSPRLAVLPPGLSYMGGQAGVPCAPTYLPQDVSWNPPRRDDRRHAGTRWCRRATAGQSSPRRHSLWGDADRGRTIQRLVHTGPSRAWVRGRTKHHRGAPVCWWQRRPDQRDSGRVSADEHGRDRDRDRSHDRRRLMVAASDPVGTGFVARLARP